MAFQLNGFNSRIRSNKPFILIAHTSSWRIKMDTTSFLVGAVAGFIVGALVFTQTGREVTGGVARATGARAERYIRPR